MNKFFIFLDVDGVLNNYQWIKHVYNNNLEKEGFNKYMCPDNVNNLNTILNTLRNYKFDPIIVISSSWRKSDMVKLEKLLKINKLDYKGTYYKTNFGFGLSREGIRGLEIKDFIHFNKINDNFMVIDDEMVDIQPHLAKEHLLKTSGLFKDGLSKENVKAFFENNFEKILNKLKDIKKR